MELTNNQSQSYSENQNFGSERIENQGQGINQGQSENQRNQEILGNDFNVGNVLQKAGTEGSGFDLGQVPILASITNNPQQIIKLITQNYSTQLNPQTIIKQNRIRRQKEFLASKNLNPNTLIDTGIGESYDLQLGDLRDSYIKALIKVITGQNVADYNDVNYQYQLAQYSQSTLVHYILNFTKLINWSDSARIYTSFKFHNPKIFDEFKTSKDSLVVGYGRFLAILSQVSSGFQNNNLQPTTVISSSQNQQQYYQNQSTNQNNQYQQNFSSNNNVNQFSGF
jgi:hypothetical protein